jgi:hypothetical protein
MDNLGDASGGDMKSHRQAMGGEAQRLYVVLAQDFSRVNRGQLLRYSTSFGHVEKAPYSAIAYQRLTFTTKRI